MLRPDARPTTTGLRTRPSMRTFATAAVLLVSWLAPGLAAAQEEDEGPPTTGAYLSIGVGISYLPLIAEEYEGRSTRNYAMKEAPAIDGRLGYRATDHIGFEVQTQYFFDGSLEAGKTKAGDISGLAFTVNGKGYLSTGSFQPYVTVGVGVLSIGLHRNDPQLPTDNEIGPGIRGGLGVEYYVSESIGVDIGASWIHGQGDVHDYDTLVGTANLILRF